MKPGLMEDLLVLTDGSTYMVLTELTHKLVYESEAADKALQYAIGALSETGGEIVLGRGDFPLDSPVSLSGSVALRGKGRGTRLLVSALNEAGIGLYCEELRGGMISNLAITAKGNSEARVGIVLDGCADSKIRNVFCVGFADYGIWMRNNTFLCEINGCSLAGNQKSNIRFDHLRKGTYGNYIPNLLTNCIIYGGGRGIECNRTVVLNIIACVVYQTRGAAYYIGNDSNSVLISGCRSFQISSHAVEVRNSHELNLSSNIFCWHTGHGIFIKDSSWGTICGNEINDTGSYNPGGPMWDTHFCELPGDIPLYNGIELSNVAGYSITGNTLFNWGVAPKMGCGIKEDSQCFRNILSGNNINYFQEADIVSEGRETVIGDNVGYGDKPHRGGDTCGTRVQSFEMELTERLIAELM